MLTLSNHIVNKVNIVVTKKDCKKRDVGVSSGKLLDAAVDLFSLRGPDAVSVDEVCMRAGLSKRMVYHYFGDKAGLYKSALERVYERFLLLEVKLAEMFLPPEQLLAELVGKYYDFLRDNEAFVRLLCFENLNNGQAIRELKLKSVKAPILDALTLALEKGQAEGRFRSDIDPKDVLISIFGLCFFYFSNRHTLGHILGSNMIAPKRLPKRKKHVISLLLEGLATDSDN